MTFNTQMNRVCLPERLFILLANESKTFELLLMAEEMVGATFIAELLRD